MGQNPPANSPLLAMPQGETQPLSIRAKALVFVDPASRALLQYVERLAPSEAPILITGETGTGKELIARHFHLLSRRKGPFVAVNCGAISEQLAESELFGHEAGAFTGATGRREGWFEAANGGTLFLDEIGDLPLNLQVKLLRVLQEREVVRIGSRKPIPIDVRLVAATNVDLDDAVTAGHFRLDLLYRLNIAQVTLPPLRERTGDIMPLAEYFLGQYSQRLNLPLPDISDAAAAALRQYAWPGNIRELENVIHFAILVSGHARIEPEHLKFSSAAASMARSAPARPALPQETPLEVIRSQLTRLFETNQPEGLFSQLEGMLVREAFEFSSQNQLRAAALLGLTRNEIRTLLARYDLLGQTARGRRDAPGHVANG
ncbi:transcriptional regulator with PAS, ATPase and Fis domain [Silvimonas terrae]|uniref:Transcriptional regulator with PAS, ATPase and Fis domain n=1 Tax=Silvimonas terrae TaxID=300266 RepID=A0A840REN1_9NEIS|nr:sigma 54-interacting transcriptional regulator [Silvimonas terrae]MBB5190762.1 transcriptional regulator with PAS, ATPase and Fis domain [Silvimonas terrae]